MREYFRGPARPMDTAAPLAVLLVLSLAGLVIGGLQGATGLGLLSTTLGVALGQGALLVALPLAGRHDGRRRPRAVLVFLGFLVSTVLVVGYLQPWAAAGPWHVPENPQTWTLHQLVGVLARDTDPRGFALEPDARAYVVLRAWSWLGGIVGLALTFLPAWMPWRIRVPAWLTLAAWGLVLFSGGLHGSVIPTDLSPASTQLFIVAPTLLLAIAYAVVARAVGGVAGEGRLEHAVAGGLPGRAVLLRSLAIAFLVLAAYLGWAVARSPLGWRGLVGNEAHAVGEPARDFRLQALDGGEVRLSELRGQVVLVNVWATWCGPCRQELPVLERLGRTLADEDLRILAVNQAEDAETIRSFLDEQGLELEVLRSTKSMLVDYVDGAIPQSFLVDRSGVVRHHHRGYGEGLEEQLEVELRALLEEGRPSPR